MHRLCRSLNQIQKSRKSPESRDNYRDTSENTSALALLHKEISSQLKELSAFLPEYRTSRNDISYQLLIKTTRQLIFGMCASVPLYPGNLPILLSLLISGVGSDAEEILVYLQPMTSPLLLASISFSGRCLMTEVWRTHTPTRANHSKDPLPRTHVWNTAVFDPWRCLGE